MPPVFEWLVVVMVPTALGWGVLGAIRAYRWLAARRPPGVVSVEPIERVGANLCRLHAALEAAENQNAIPFKSARLRALRAAYIDVLAAACRQLEVNPPTASGGDQVPLAEIYRAEAALRERGLDVRLAAPH